MDPNLLNQLIERAHQWLTPFFDSTTHSEVEELLHPQNESKLLDAFYKSLEFGTGGMRGVMGAGTNRMNKYTVGIATQGLAQYMKRSFANEQVKVVIGHDCRHNSRFFSEVVANIFSANGIYVYLWEDLRPTPEVSFAIRHLECHGGVIITASHNPKEYNGYKVYWRDGGQIVPPHDKAIIKEIEKTSVEEVQFDGVPSLIESIGKEMDEEFLKQVCLCSYNPEVIRRQRDLKIVYTPIHGTGVHIIPEAIRRYGFEGVYNVPEQDVVSGDFPTVVSPNPEEESAMEMAIRKGEEIGADIIMATDPDSDRLGVASPQKDGHYLLLNGNQTFLLFMYYIFRMYQEQGRWTGKEYMAKTIVTTELAAQMAKKYNIPCYDCYTGFKYIAQVIGDNESTNHYIGGGEESFGFLPNSFVRDKDAVTSIALMAEIAAWAKDHNLTLWQLMEQIYLEYGFSKEHMIYIVKKGKEGAEEIEEMMAQFRENPPKTMAGEAIQGIKDYQVLEEKRADGSIKPITDKRGETSNVLQFFTENMKVSIRPSGTEPKIKFYFEVRRHVGSTSEISQADIDAQNSIDQIVQEWNLS